MLPSDLNSKYVSVEERDGIVVVTLNLSHITDEENIEQLGFELFALVDQYGCRKVVIVMKQVEYLTSSVLGKLITMHRKLGRTDGQLVLCEIGEAVEEILTTSNLDIYFTIADTVDAAMAVLKGD